MSLNQAYNAYKTARETSSKTRQVIMLYEAALAAVQQAREAMVSGDVNARFQHLEKAVSILVGLQQSIDFEQGGDVAQLLYDYYSGTLNHIYKVQRFNSMDSLEKTSQRLREMLQSWRNIEAQERGSVPAVSGDDVSQIRPDALIISA